MGPMDDAFTLLRRAAGLLPEDAAAENGWTVADARAELGLQEWELALDLLVDIADVHPVPVDFWETLAEAARQMMSERTRRWCEWRDWERRNGTIRATLTLLPADESRRGRRTAFAGDGRLRPLWDLGTRTADGRSALNVARLWVESAPQLGPGGTADVRLAPLTPEQWRHLTPGDVITLHEARPVGGRAEIIEVRPPQG
ncbi:hypothetical protein OG294_07385 [Kitasatospora sp. NBC_01302]|nr:hypothetical protein OG294_07385 [Kitasatospora sp. NBC_01302]